MGLEDDDIGMAVDSEPIDEPLKDKKDDESVVEEAAHMNISSNTEKLLEQSRSDIMNIS